MATLQLGSGKKQKVRPGDILGALTGEAGLAGDQVGKIKVLANSAFVAVRREVADEALARLLNGRTKGRCVRARRLGRRGASANCVRRDEDTEATAAAAGRRPERGGRRPADERQRRPALRG